MSGLTIRVECVTRTEKDEVLIDGTRIYAKREDPFNTVYWEELTGKEARPYLEGVAHGIAFGLAAVVRLNKPLPDTEGQAR